MSEEKRKAAVAISIRVKPKIAEAFEAFTRGLEEKAGFKISKAQAFEAMVRKFLMEEDSGGD